MVPKHKKTSKSGLTAARRKRRRSPSLGLSVDARDQLNEHLRKIEMLADFMGVCDPDQLADETVEGAGRWIAAELRGIRAVLEKHL